MYLAATARYVPGSWHIFKQRQHQLFQGYLLKQVEAEDKIKDAIWICNPLHKKYARNTILLLSFLISD